MRRLILALVCIACASQGFPPGGPPHKDPPKLLSVVPESGSINVHPKSVAFHFDEVINEVAGGSGGLEALFLVSPREGKTRVSWHRNELDVRGQHGFRANTAYTITLLPGLADLRGNVTKKPITVVFATGGGIPDGRISGIVFDWIANRPAANAAIEALGRPDTTLVYVAQSDSSGHFAIPFMTAGTYTVRGYIDANSNHILDPREAWDSVHVALKDTAAVELLAFVHDTIGPRLSTVDVRDSVTLRVSFDRPVDPAQTLDTSFFTLKAPDSTTVPLRRVLSAAKFDTLVADSARRADSIRVRADTSLRYRVPLTPPVDSALAAIPKPSRPPPIVEVVVELAQPLQPVKSYRLEAHGVRGLLGKLANSLRTFSTPKPLAPDSTKKGTAADSLRRRATADTSRRPPPAATPTKPRATPPVATPKPPR